MLSFVMSDHASLILAISGLAVTVLLHMFVVVWWASKLTQRVEQNGKRISAMEKTIGTRGFAICQVHGEQLRNVIADLDEIKRRIE